MICPILSSQSSCRVDCLQEKCAWWLNTEGRKCCAVTALPMGIQDIVEQIYNRTIWKK